MIGGGRGGGGGGGGVSPPSSNSGGQFLLQLLQNKPQPQPPPHPHPTQDPAVAAMGPTLPFPTGQSNPPPPWLNQPCLPHEFFPPPWAQSSPQFPTNQLPPLFSEDFQRLGLLGNGKPPPHQPHHLPQQQQNSNRPGLNVDTQFSAQKVRQVSGASRSSNGPEIGFNSSQNHREFDRQVNSHTTRYAPHELWGRREQPVHHAPPPGFHQKQKGLQRNVDKEGGSRDWDNSGHSHQGNGSSRLGIGRQIDHPGPRMASKGQSVPASRIEESLANLRGFEEERRDNRSMGSSHGREDLADKFMDSVLVRDRFEKKIGVRHYNDFRDKEFASKEIREVSAPVQRIRNHRRGVVCRSDINRMNAPFLTIFESLVPAEEEKAKQKQLLTLLEKLVNKEWPESELYLYGSCANTFGVSKSDIDVCLAIKDLDGSKSELLLKLADILQADKLENVQALTRARVPIVKLMDPATGISCDICINNVLAVVNTKLLRDYAQIDGRLRQLAFIVKHWAKSRGVNVTYEGTLSSYAYVLMCIHFLQQRQPAILPCLQRMEATYAVTVDDIECAYYDQVENLHNFGVHNKESISELVWAFFDYWAFRHDYANAVISVRTGSIISKREKDWTRRIGNDRHLICIEDPFQISHDLGRVVDKYSIKVLREEFERAANILQYDPDPCVTLFEPYIPS